VSTHVATIGDSITRYQYMSLAHLVEGGWGVPSPLQGFWLTNCSRSGTCRVPPDEFDRQLDRAAAGDVDWKQPFPEAIRRTGALRKLLPKPDVAIYSRGLWGLLNESRAKQIMPSLACTTGSAERVPAVATSDPPPRTTGRCTRSTTTFGTSSSTSGRTCSAPAARTSTTRT
jgi:hypothetical protein